MGQSGTGDVSTDFTAHAGSTSPYTTILEETRVAEGKLATLPVAVKTGPQSKLRIWQ